MCKVREPSFSYCQVEVLKTAELLRLKCLNFFHNQINIAKILEKKIFSFECGTTTFYSIIYVYIVLVFYCV